MIRTHGEKAKYASEMLGSNYRMSRTRSRIGSGPDEKVAKDFVAKRRKTLNNSQNPVKV
jgi:dTDP-4-amino-4,6-dideoxygalactose transaminase